MSDSDSKTSKPAMKAASKRPNPSAVAAEKAERKGGTREGVTPAADLAKVPADLDEPDEITPTHGTCPVCEIPGKTDEAGKMMPHRAHGHSGPDDDPLCDGTGEPAREYAAK